MPPRPRLSLLLRPGLALCLTLSAHFAVADEPAKTDARYPFRTDFANANLPWYQPKPLEFPPYHSDRRIAGELVAVDYIHRTGQFRSTQTGELMDFALPPYGSVSYLGAEADLRDVPLGTFFLFFLHQDPDGNFTRLATMQDQYTMDASHSFVYRLDEVHTDEGKLLTTKISTAGKPDLGKKDLLVTAATRIWKDGKAIALTDLKPGDELLCNLTGRTAAKPGTCTDLWIGRETHTAATEEQRKRHAAYLKWRGLPAWIDKTEKNIVTLTFLSGDAAVFKKTWGPELAEGKGASLCVANDELRTWNPPVDKEGCSIVAARQLPVDGYGASGLQIDVRVTNMLEGFRRGRCLRVLCSGWQPKDAPYGESLMGYGFGAMQNKELIENVAKEYPDQFPFRTDFGNRHLPWYQVSPGKQPPPFAEHLVLGELVSANAATGRGQMRVDRTGALVDFALLPEAEVKYLNAKATLADVPPGTRCRFGMFQDAQGAFTIAGQVSDEFTRLASNVTTLRVEALNLAEGKLHVAQMLPLVKDYNGDMQRPPDLGHAELRVSDSTRVWKQEQQVKLSDLAVGDVLLVNVTSEQKDAPSRCTDIWIGEDTHKLVTERQTKKLASAKK